MTLTSGIMMSIDSHYLLGGKVVGHTTGWWDDRSRYRPSIGMVGPRTTAHDQSPPVLP